MYGSFYFHFLVLPFVHTALAAESLDSVPNWWFITNPLVSLLLYVLWPFLSVKVLTFHSRLGFVRFLGEFLILSEDLSLMSQAIIGPADLALCLSSETLTTNPDATIPTVTDNLFSQGVINSNEIGISFEPTTSDEVMNGELTWSQSLVVLITQVVLIAPSSLSRSTLRKRLLNDLCRLFSLPSRPITSTFPANQFWGVDHGTSTQILSSTAEILV